MPLPPPEIYTVARLNQDVRLLIESGMGTLWLEAELSNFSIPSSGHWYFSLKDSRAQIRCAMFKGANSKLIFRPQDGDKLLVRGKVSLYEPRGDFQLIVEHIELAGNGALQIAFEKLKAKLADEGLFDQSHKKDFPELPRCIGVITSSTGAAIHDILTVLKRRFPAIPVIIYPSMVQGEGAAITIVEAITLANQRKECDVLILARGGGSLEDLWCFNEENVARAIFASKIPIVTGVGHEVDVTIADFVADHRAPTPSAAAEFVSPSRQEYIDFLLNLQQRLIHHIKHTFRYYLQQLQYLQKRLQHPGQKLQQQMQKTDYLQQLLIKNMRHHLKHHQQHLASIAIALDAYSPLSTLGRGYSITQKDTLVIRESTQLKPNDKITTRLNKGSVISIVKEVIT